MKKSSVHAERGTAAHTLVETCLEQRLEDSHQYRDYWINQKGDIQRAAPRNANGEPCGDSEDGWFIVDEDMMSAVDVMLSTVYGELERLGPQAELGIERKFDLGWLRPDMFGTSDVTISLFLTELVVVDYKHGQGVPVEVAERDPVTGKLKMNSQLGYYALGVAEADGFTHETVTLVVVQPRCPHEEGPVRRYSFPMSELLELRDRLAKAADEVREAEEALRAVYAGDDPVTLGEWEAQYLRAGDHCQKSFCPKLGTPCAAAFAHAQKVAMADFADDPYVLDVPTGDRPEDLARLSYVLRWTGFLDGFVKAATTHALRAKVDHGVAIPNHKLVRGRSTRAYSASEAEVVAAVSSHVQSHDDLYAPRKLKSPAQMEKLGKEVKKLLAGVPHPKWNPNDPTSPEWLHPPLVQKRPGKVTLAHEDDPRPEVTVDASADFDDEYMAGEGVED